MRSADVDTERIGALLRWLVLPWGLKWLWAPRVDVKQHPRWSLRAWIGVTQVCGHRGTLFSGLALGVVLLATSAAIELQRRTCASPGRRPWPGG